MQVFNAVKTILIHTSGNWTRKNAQVLINKKIELNLIKRIIILVVMCYILLTLCNFFVVKDVNWCDSPSPTLMCVSDDNVIHVHVLYIGIWQHTSLKCP